MRDMNKYANLGFFFQRGYYKGLKRKMLEEKSSDVEAYFKKQNDDLINSSKIIVHPDKSLFGVINESFKLQTIYPGLVTGIGMIHETGLQGESKLGMAFDYTNGIPTIPGSSVKGLLRSMFPILSPNKPKDKLTDNELNILEEKNNFIIDSLKSINNSLAKLDKEDVEDLAMLIFEGQYRKGSFLPIYERDIFFDAQIEGDYRKNGILGLDFITPHKNQLQDPIPIQFLKIMPGVNFVFNFRLNKNRLSSGLEISAEDKKKLFKTILTTVGIGAKTNVGYGQLK